MELKLPLFDLENNDINIRSRIAKDLLLNGNYSLSVNKCNILTRNSFKFPCFYNEDGYGIVTKKINRNMLNIALKYNILIVCEDKFDYRLYRSLDLPYLYILCLKDIVKCVFDLNASLGINQNSIISLKVNDNYINIVSNSLSIRFRILDFNPEGIFKNNKRLCE